MPKLLRLLTAAVLGLAFAVAPVAAQDLHINPVPPHTRPQWTPVPNAPGVYYAPNLPTDVFRHGGKYYFYWAGYLYRSSKPKGPWKSVTQPPAWFSEIDPAYFKTAGKGPTGPPGGPPGPSGTEGQAPVTPAPAPEAAPPAAPEPERAPGAPVIPPTAPSEPGKAPKVM